MDHESFSSMPKHLTAAFRRRFGGPWTDVIGLLASAVALAACAPWVNPAEDPGLGGPSLLLLPGLLLLAGLYWLAAAIGFI